MKLQRKTLLITSASALFLFSIVFTTSAAIVWNGFVSLERKEILDHTLRARAVLAEQLDDLTATAREWSLRDEKRWLCVDDGEQDFEDDAFAGSSLNLLLVIDEQGQLISRRAVDSKDRKPVAFPSDLAGRDWLDDPLTRPGSGRDGRSGVLTLSEGNALISAVPLPATGADRSCRGTLLVGKWLDQPEIRRLSKLTKLDLSLRRLGPADDPSATGGPLPPRFEILDRDTAVGRFTLTDPDRRPVLQGTVLIPRKIAAQGRACITHMLVGLIVAGIGFALVVRRVIDRIVLSRLLKLVAEVRRLGQSNVTGKLELNVEGNDELTDLAVAVDEMARDLCLIRDVSATANAADGRAEVALQTTLDRICDVLDWPLAHVFVVHDEYQSKDEPLELWNRDVEPRFRRFQEATAEMCRTANRGLIDRVVDSGQSVWLANIQADNSCARRDVAAQCGIQAAFGFPICVGNTVVAVVEMFSLRTRRPDAGIIRLAEQTGSQIGRVFERNRTARELQRLNKQIADSAHQEGMAEVATSVLHNVGNVLNSVNVSATLIRDIIEHSEMRLYRRAADLLEEHLSDLPRFVRDDDKGRHLPRYLLAGARRLDQEYQEIDSRVVSLEENIDHIKTIIAMQQAYARVRGNQQFLSVTELLDDALHLYKDSFSSLGIEVVRNYQPVPRIESDRHRLMQIINNLLKNAQESLVESAARPRRIAVSAITDEEGRIRIQVEDNGGGIAPENLGKIFTHGFTTKESGHGFGLHGCANSIKEMGGTIGVASDGIGRGATFALELPVILEGVEA